MKKTQNRESKNTCEFWSPSRDERAFCQTDSWNRDESRFPDERQKGITAVKWLKRFRGRCRCSCTHLWLRARENGGRGNHCSVFASRKCPEYRERHLYGVVKCLQHFLLEDLLQNVRDIGTSTVDNWNYFGYTLRMIFGDQFEDLRSF